MGIVIVLLECKDEKGRTLDSDRVGRFCRRRAINSSQAAMTPTERSPKDLKLPELVFAMFNDLQSKG